MIAVVLIALLLVGFWIVLQRAVQMLFNDESAIECVSHSQGHFVISDFGVFVFTAQSRGAHQ